MILDIEKVVIRYDITNSWGYMGRYQFGKSTLKGLGFDVTRTEFLK